MVRTIRSVHPRFAADCCNGILVRLKPAVFATAMVLLLLAGIAPRAWAAPPPTFTVTVTTDTTSGTASNCNQTQGGETPNANCSLRDAIAAATAAGGSTVVNFDSALTSGGAVTIALGFINGPIEITSAVNIAGPGATLLTVSDPDGGVFLVGNGHNAGPISISGLTFANTGYSVGPIGAIFINSSATVTVSNCTFSNNSTKSGGGGIANVGTLTVIDSTFSDNYGGQGGGGIDNSGTLTVSNSTFSGNSGTGGGINNSGTLTVSNSTFSGNSGSAIYNGSGTLTVSNSIFSSNSGGGISNNGATANASYNVFFNNTVNGSEADCTGCTSNTNAIDDDPKLAQLGNYGGTTQTMLPQPGSAAICAGSAALVPPGLTTDQRGFPLNPSCVDAGAVQTNYLMVNTIHDDGIKLGSCPSSSCSLRDAITQANSDGMGDIAFQPGLTGTIVIGPLGPFPPLGGQINLVGPGAGNLTVSGNNETGVFGTSGNVSISGLTIANAGQGARYEVTGLYNDGQLTVTECSFLNNHNFFFGEDGGAITNSGSLTVRATTFSGNGSSIPSTGGGAITNSGWLTIIDSTFSGNFAGLVGVTISSAGIILNNGSLTLNNSIFSDASGSSDISNSGSLTVDNNVFSSTNGSGGIYNSPTAVANASYNVFFNNDCNSCTSNTNATYADPKLAPLGNYGGPTPTMLPLPGSAAICAGSTTLIPTNLATDQRGFPRLNSTYTGNPCVDAGAVQTNYQSVQFTNAASGYSAVVNQVLNPAPIVSVTENGQNIGGVPVTLTFSGTGKASGLGPVTTTAGIGATFGGLSVDAVGSDTLAATLEITPSYTLMTNPTAALDITLTKASQTINFTPPTSPVTYGVSPITLVATATSGLVVTFTVQSGPGMISGNILTITAQAQS